MKGNVTRLCRGSILSWSSISYSNSGNMLLEDVYEIQAKVPVRGRGCRLRGGKKSRGKVSIWEKSKPTTQMQCSQAEKRSHGKRRASSVSSSPPGPGGNVISSAGEMLLASWSSSSSGSSTCSPSSSGPCRAMATARHGHSRALD
ncbi:hypothetical protein INR49_001836 [Caranx melampygus]|nr:hypothetical protein INR49_001836 [Caranx melampygus]